jgi:hypothetical protein
MLFFHVHQVWSATKDFLESCEYFTSSFISKNLQTRAEDSRGLACNRVEHVALHVAYKPPVLQTQLAEGSVTTISWLSIVYLIE